jgi:hypothetical protein
MGSIMITIWIFLAVFAIAGVTYASLKLKTANTRISRSIDPISLNTKTLKIELSALTRSRLDRQRRLEDTGSKKTRSRK